MQPKIVPINKIPNHITIDEAPRGKPTPLWPGYLYRGTLTQLAGDPGVGKTMLLCDLAARALSGGPWPGETATFDPLKVLMVLTEDPIPLAAQRIYDAGIPTGTNNLTFISNVTPFHFYHLLNYAPSQFDLVLIETLDAHLPSGTNSNDSVAVRQGLEPLLRGAEHLDASIIGARHWNKNTTASISHRALGSTAFSAVARTCMNLSFGLDLNGQRTRILSVDKANLAAPPTPLSMDIVDQGGAVRIQWQGPCPQMSYGLDSEVADAVDFLRGLLLTPMKSVDVQAAARANGIPPHTLNAAKVYLKIKPQKVGGPGQVQCWIWKI